MKRQDFHRACKFAPGDLVWVQLGETPTPGAVQAVWRSGPIFGYQVEVSLLSRQRVIVAESWLTSYEGK